MVSLLILAQEIFSQVQKSTQSNPTDFSSTGLPKELVAFLFSPSALIEWFKIFIFGTLLVALRNSLSNIYTQVYDSFFITATFEDSDITYSWLSFWLSRQPAWRNARAVEVSTASLFRDPTAKEPDSTIPGSGQQLTYLPSNNVVRTAWYKRHRMWVTRRKETETGVSDEGVSKRLELCILSRSRKVLNNIIIDAKREYLEAQQNRVSIFVRGRYDGSWQILASRRKRPLSSIILDPGIKDVLIEDSKEFLSSKGWYTARGIPFRRGYLLYGTPGSGKTSLIHSIAGELGLNVYVIPLSKANIDDTTLNEHIAELPEKCIAVMEDIDVTLISLNRESNGPDAPDDNVVAKKAMIPSSPPSRITLSGLLNALDGVGAQEGRILFATTNKYDSLDPALCRPGRLDVHLEFRLASRYQARELFKCFYMPEEQGGDEDSSDISLLEKQAGPHPVVSVSPDEVERLAEEFANAIPEREFSMANLQGYLMAYKVSPVDAAKGAAVWVRKEREGKGKRKGGRKDEKLINGVPGQASDI